MRAEERRESIMREAVRLFSEKGFKGTTTREIAAAVGVSEPILYEHFRTKQDLYAAIMQSIEEQSLENMNALIDAHVDAQDDRAFFLGLSNAVVEWFLRAPEFVRLLLFSSLERDGVGRAFHGHVVATMAGAIRRYAAARRTVRKVNPEVLAHMLLCMMAHHGLLQVLFSPNDSRNHDETIESMVDVLLCGIYR